MASITAHRVIAVAAPAALVRTTAEAGGNLIGTVA